MKKPYVKKTSIVIATILASLMLLSACSSGSSNPPSGGNSSSSSSSSGGGSTTPPENTTEPKPDQKKDKTFGDLIEFDDLDIVFGNDIAWTAVSNQFSDKNGEEVFLVPITVKNTKDETHGLNMFYYTQFGSQGTKLDSIGHFFDNEIGSAGDMRSGAVQESVMAFLYDGDGDYYVEFSTMFGKAIEVRLPIIWEDNSASQLSDTPATLISSSPSVSSDVKTFGDVFEFDDIEIVFSPDIAWSTVNNQFSDKNGMDVFLIRVTIKNIKDETHGLNMFYYTQFGSQGTKLDGIGHYFDNEIGSAGDMRSGASQDVSMAFLYDGDGDYYVEFSTMFGKAIEVKLPIKK